MTTEEERVITPIAEETEQVEEAVPVEQDEEFQNAVDTETGEEDVQEPQNSESEDKQETEAGANDAAPDDADVASPAPTAASTVAVANKPAGEEDRRSEIEKQPYAFDQCTVQIAIQLLPEDGNEKGRPVLLGVRTHLDAPILQVLRLSELGELPPAIKALVDQIKSELPAREQAAKERIEKERIESLQRRLKTAKPPRHSKPEVPEKPKTVQTAAAPAKPVLTANQRANAVNQAADEKQQLAMF